MWRLRLTALILVVVAVLALAALGFLRLIFGSVDNDQAQAEVQELFESAGREDVEVRTCRSATKEDVDSPTSATFVCTVAARPSCTRNVIFFVRRAIDSGWIDNNTLGPENQPTQARDPSDLHRVCQAQ